MITVYLICLFSRSVFDPQSSTDSAASTFSAVSDAFMDSTCSSGFLQFFVTTANALLLQDLPGEGYLPVPCIPSGFMAARFDCL